MDNIGVRPNTTSASVQVATDEVDGVHYPVYKLATGADGEAILLDTGNRLPVQLPDLTHETDAVAILNEISKKLSVLIKYESMLHKMDIEEDE